MLQPLQIESLPDMTPRVTDPSIPPDSGECHSFKLPAEIRVVIYDLLLCEFDFSSPQEIEGGGDSNEAQNGSCGPGDDANTNENADGEDGDDEEQYEDEIDEEEQSDHEGSIDLGDESEDDGDQFEDDDEEDQEDRDDIQSPSEDKDDRAHLKNQLLQLLNSGDYPTFIRPPILNACRLIRKEAAPRYTFRHSSIVLDIIKEATQTFQQFKGGAGLFGGHFEHFVLHDAAVHGLRTTKCIMVSKIELLSLGQRLGVVAARGDELKKEFGVAVDGFDKAVTSVIASMVRRYGFQSWLATSDRAGWEAVGLSQVFSRSIDWYNGVR